MYLEEVHRLLSPDLYNLVYTYYRGDLECSNNFPTYTSCVNSLSRSNTSCFLSCLKKIKDRIIDIMINDCTITYGGRIQAARLHEVHGPTGITFRTTDMFELALTPHIFDDLEADAKILNQYDFPIYFERDDLIGLAFHDIDNNYHDWGKYLFPDYPELTKLLSSDRLRFDFDMMTDVESKLGNDFLKHLSWKSSTFNALRERIFLQTCLYVGYVDLELWMYNNLQVPFVDDLNNTYELLGSTILRRIDLRQ